MGKERFKLIVAVYCMLIKNGKILMLRRFNTGYEDGNYSFPAGHVEEGESFKETAVREAKEEIGIDVKLEDISLAHVMHRVPLGRISVFMKAEKWEGVIRNIEPEKCDDLSWFNLDVLPKNTIPYIKKTIEDYKQKNVYSEDKQI
ncbi:MAG: ADP-ribose pyrophosphatase [Candidatus Moranbacteria bacterium GW2011_GWE1_49_15]|nr:MAG: ADP-ribose pyrophosphatase [Candidatus Moranbacteria bacterium GW2011_GWE2_47_10]KKW07184.1 MAG: ADP-ribose pyrophosphatase [Candidatus Moranbacteria bacterium GW2011_GWE1_49_15]HBP01330.1 NUDIX hydrolase [Candidatus Moranbacteria bacterium]